MLLERITSPADVKALDASQLPLLCQEIRDAIITSSAAVGGHVGPNLGTVELTVALHRVFTSPRDKLIFDVSHQTYAHKMLTGRAAAFIDPAHYNDVSGFSNPSESPHDLFSMGHTSTSVSLACGMVKARDLAHEDYDVVAIIGDGSLSGGLAFEGFDNVAELGSGLIVVINDNDWSIAENHGGIYRHLAELRATQGQAPHNIFRILGFDYRFVANGNDEAAVEAALAAVKGTTHPVVLHLVTTKGAGYAPAVADAEAWHHVGPFDAATGQPRPAQAAAALSGDGDGAAGGAGETSDAPAAASAAASAAFPETYAEITGAYLSERIAHDPALVVITAAQPYIMGFTPERRAAAGAQFVDVGIAEEHAVTFATGLARAGARPVLGLYGVFMQRAYDQFWHDLCLNNVPAVILDFGASIFGTSDCTHLGFFDLALMGPLPHLNCLAPVCREEYEAMLAWACTSASGPTVIRVPGQGVERRPDLAPVPGESFDTPRYQMVRRGSRVAVLALGSFFPLGERVADALAAHGIAPTLVNPRFATAFDTAALDELTARHRVVVTLEDGVIAGGWGEKIARLLGHEGVSVRCYGIAKGFPDRFDPAELLAQNGMTVDAIVADILHDLGKSN